VIREDPLGRRVSRPASRKGPWSRSAPVCSCSPFVSRAAAPRPARCVTASSPRPPTRLWLAVCVAPARAPSPPRR